MSNREDRLRARVEARNLAGAEVNRIRPLLREFFAAYVGKKVLKADGSLLKSIEDALKSSGIFRETDRRLQVYRSTSNNYSLSWVSRACVNIDGEVAYEESWVYIADLDGTEIRCLSNDHGDERTDFTVEEVKRLRADYEAKKKIADDAKSALHPFGEYDR